MSDTQSAIMVGKWGHASTRWCNQLPLINGGSYLWMQSGSVHPPILVLWTRTPLTAAEQELSLFDTLLFSSPGGVRGFQTVTRRHGPNGVSREILSFSFFLYCWCAWFCLASQKANKHKVYWALTVVLSLLNVLHDFGFCSLVSDVAFLFDLNRKNSQHQ